MAIHATPDEEGHPLRKPHGKFRESARLGISQRSGRSVVQLANQLPDRSGAKYASLGQLLEWAGKQSELLLSRCESRRDASTVASRMSLRIPVEFDDIVDEMVRHTDRRATRSGSRNVAQDVRRFDVTPRPLRRHMAAYTHRDDFAEHPNLL